MTNVPFCNQYKVYEFTWPFDCGIKIAQLDIVEFQSQRAQFEPEPG